MSVDSRRVISDLQELRALTADANGAQRLAWSPMWLKAREWFQGKLEGLPVEHHYDAAGNNWANTGTQPSDSSVGKGQFVLVLKNGIRYSVGDYWVAEGYLEYTISDGTRSQVPLESLDLEATVAANSPRGLPFVLRSSPGPNPH